MRRLIRFTIDSHELIGERLRVDGYLARTGIQIYNDGINERREYRSPEEVFSEDSLASFRGMPVTIQHPRVMVTARTWKQVAVGHVGDDVRRSDDGEHVAASIWLHDAKAITRVQSGELQELSVGYLARLDETPGVAPSGEKYDARQTEIRGNHVALLRQGQARGGPTVALRLDSNGDQPWEMEEMKQKIQIGEITYEVDSADTSLQSAVQKIASKLEVEIARADGLKTDLEKITAERDTLREDLDKRLAAERADARVALLENAKKIAPKFVAVDEQGPEEIRRAVLDSLKINTAGKSDAYVEARFEMELTREIPIDKVRPTHQKVDSQITVEQRAAGSIDDAIRYIGGL